MTEKYCRRGKHYRDRETEFQRNRSNKDGYNDWCKECYTEYLREYGREKRASRTPEQEEAQQAISRRYYKSHRTQVIANSNRQGARRRVKIRGNKTELINNQEIFERDGWICQICNQPVDQSLRFPHPGSKSLDHIIPVSRGGQHLANNVQLTHLICNVRKGGRIPSDKQAG